MLPIALTPRQLVAIIGGLVLIVAAFALVFAPVGVSFTTSGLFGTTTSVDCGTTVMPNAVYGAGQTDCEEAIGDRRAWGWPLAVGGGIVLAAALFVQTSAERETEPED